MMGDELAHLVGLVGGGSGNLALLTRRELGEVTVVVALPTIFKLGEHLYTGEEIHQAESM